MYSTRRWYYTIRLNQARPYSSLKDGELGSNSPQASFVLLQARRCKFLHILGSSYFRKSNFQHKSKNNCTSEALSVAKDLQLSHERRKNCIDIKIPR